MEKQITTVTKPTLEPLTNSRETFYQTLTVSGLSEAINSNSHPIGEIQTIVTEGDVFVKALVYYILTDLLKFVNVGKTMSADQINQTVDFILKDYAFLKVEDFKLFTQKFKRGIYGKLYDRIDGQIILEALDIYVYERMEQAQHESDLKHEQNLKGRIEGVVNPEGQKKVIEALKTVVESVKPEIKELPKQETKKIVKSERDSFIQACFAEFDNLLKTNAIKIDGKDSRFIKYLDHPVDSVEYVILKLAEFDSLIKENKDLEL